MDDLLTPSQIKEAIRANKAYLKSDREVCPYCSEGPVKYWRGKQGSITDRIAICCDNAICKTNVSYTILRELTAQELFTLRLIQSLGEI